MTASPIKLLAIFIGCLLLANCAQTGPPLPPSLELPKPPTDLRAARKGDRITLTWSEPTHTTDRQIMRYFGSTRICRSLEAEMKECGSPVGDVPPPRSEPLFGVGQAPLQSYVDILPATIPEQKPSGDVIYAVEVLNRDDRSAGLSNRATVPAVSTLPPPSDFHAELTGNGIAFGWTSAAEAAAPGVQHRYRIYRRDESTSKDTIASEILVTGVGALQAQDSTFEWEKTYLYRITSVSVVSRPGGEVQVEGDDSPEVRLVAHDVFPPAVPSSLQAVYSGEGQKPFIDLIWAPVTDADLAGYNVYRRDGEGGPAKLNLELIKSPSYRDDAVVPGKTYFYSVSSVDLRGNESARSEAASETAP